MKRFQTYTRGLYQNILKEVKDEEGVENEFKLRDINQSLQFHLILSANSCWRSKLCTNHGTQPGESSLNDCRNQIITTRSAFNYRLFKNIPEELGTAIIVQVSHESCDCEYVRSFYRPWFMETWIISPTQESVTLEIRILENFKSMVTPLRERK
jgi:hypothetical protein